MSFTHKILLNLLTKEECGILLNFSLNNLKLKPAEVISETTNGINSNVRKSNIEFYNYNKKFSFLIEKINKAINEFIYIKGHDLDYENSSFQFTEYKPGDFFAWHVDIDLNNRIKSFKPDRYCTIILQLNEEYSGGILDIKTNDNNTISLEKGTGNMIIFLSELEHRVTPILSGNRYTIVNWIYVTPKNNYKKTLL